MKSTINTLLAFVTVGATMSHATLVSHWTFDESSGTTAADSTGAFPGALSGGATFVPGGVSGNAISLAAVSNSLVNMGFGFPAFTSGDFSITSWIKTTTTAQPAYIVSKVHGDGSVNGYVLALNVTGSYGAPNKAWFYGTSSPSGIATSTSDVNDGNWHQLVGVFTAGLSLSIYVDGVLQNTKASPPPMSNGGGPFVIGGYETTALYTGLVDDVQVYSNALTSTEVQFLHNNPGQVIVPEPASVALLVSGAGLLLFKRRRPLVV